MPDDLDREPVTIVGDALHPPTLPHKPRVAVCFRDNAGPAHVAVFHISPYVEPFADGGGVSQR